MQSMQYISSHFTLYSSFRLYKLHFILLYLVLVTSLIVQMCSLTFSSIGTHHTQPHPSPLLSHLFYFQIIIILFLFLLRDHQSFDFILFSFIHSHTHSLTHSLLYFILFYPVIRLVVDGTRSIIVLHDFSDTPSDGQSDVSTTYVRSP